MPERRPFCADLARENGEPLSATASRVDHWILIEYRGLWTRDALLGSGLSDQVKARLREQVRARLRGRVLFVRRPDRRGLRELVAYVADAREGLERLRRIEITHHEDLREIDLLDEGIGVAVDHSLFLVCTHGKHDPCCARYGRPLYEALRDELDPAWVWQTTHIGGDRFAGNLVCLPHGLYYGRADRGASVAILDEHLAGRIELEHYRGRSCYAFPVQAAERRLREATGRTGIGDLSFRGTRREGTTLVVTFAVGGAVHELEVEEEDGDLTYLTCNASDVQRPRRYAVKRR
jgi:hypothetical protein